MNYFGKLIWIRLKFVKKFSFCFCRVSAKLRNRKNQLSVSDHFFAVKLRYCNIFNFRMRETSTFLPLTNTSLPLPHSDNLNE